MNHHAPITQGLKDKLRDAGFAIPEQKYREKWHNNSESKHTTTSKEKTMTQQSQVQQQQPSSEPTQPTDVVTEQVTRLGDALAKRISGERAKEVQWASITEFGIKAAITVAAVAAGTAAVTLIVKASGVSPTPELPSPVSSS